VSSLYEVCETNAFWGWLCVSVSPSVCMIQLENHWMDWLGWVVWFGWVRKGCFRFGKDGLGEVCKDE
jgi:hypothetical protein